MTKYLMLKHYRGPFTHLYTPGDQWTAEEWDAHIKYMRDFADRLKETGEYVSETALSMDGVWVRFDGENNPPLTDGPFAETKDLVAGWMMIDVESHERALNLAAELSAAPGAGGKAIGEWLELRPVMHTSLDSTD